MAAATGEVIVNDWQPSILTTREVSKSEILSAENLVNNLVNGEWLDDSDLKQTLIKDLTTYLIALDTTSDGGTDFKLFESFLVEALRPLGLYFDIARDASNNRPFFLISNRSTQITKFRSIKNQISMGDKETIHFDLLIHAHIDTVGFTGKYGGEKVFQDPKKQMLYGRGACDDKGQLATMLVSIAELAWRGLGENISIGFVISSDEEKANTFSDKFISILTHGLAIDLEPTGGESGVMGNEILKTSSISFAMPNSLKEGTVIAALSETLRSNIFPDCDYSIESKNGRVYISAFNTATGKSYKFTQTQLNILANIDATKMEGALVHDHEGFGVKINIGNEVLNRLNFILLNNYPHTYYDRETVLTKVSPNGSPRTVKMSHFFASAFSLFLRGNTDNLAIVSVADLGRHSDLEAVSIKDLGYLLKTLVAIYKSGLPRINIEQ